MLIAWYLSKKWEKQGLKDNPLPEWMQGVIGFVDSMIVLLPVGVLVYYLA